MALKQQLAESERARKAEAKAHKSNTEAQATEFQDLQDRLSAIEADKAHKDFVRSQDSEWVYGDIERILLQKTPDQKKHTMKFMKNLHGLGGKNVPQLPEALRWSNISVLHTAQSQSATPQAIRMATALDKRLSEARALCNDTLRILALTCKTQRRMFAVARKVAGTEAVEPLMSLPYNPSSCDGRGIDIDDEAVYPIDIGTGDCKFPQSDEKAFATFVAENCRVLNALTVESIRMANNIRARALERARKALYKDLGMEYLQQLDQHPDADFSVFDEGQEARIQDALVFHATVAEGTRNNGGKANRKKLYGNQAAHGAYYPGGGRGGGYGGQGGGYGGQGGGRGGRRGGRGGRGRGGRGQGRGRGRGRGRYRGQGRGRGGHHVHFVRPFSKRVQAKNQSWSRSNSGSGNDGGGGAYPSQ